jgi:hypothetical protein
MRQLAIPQTRPKAGHEQEFKAHREAAQELAFQFMVAPKDDDSGIAARLTAAFDAKLAANEPHLVTSKDTAGAPYGADMSPEAYEAFQARMLPFIFDDPLMLAVARIAVTKDEAVQQAVREVLAKQQDVYSSVPAALSASMQAAKDGMSSDYYWTDADLIFKSKLLDPVLIDEAAEDHTASEVLSYADRLEQDVNKQPDHEEAPALRELIAWLRFWGGNDFGFYSW